MTGSSDIVFLLDVDNTLLDNDRVTADLRALPRAARSAPTRADAVLRRSSKSCAQELGYADYLGALQRYRVEHPHDPHLLRGLALPRRTTRSRTGCIPASLDAIDAPARASGRPSSCPTATSVFQPRKIERSGLLRGGRRPRAHLHPQGAGARRRRAPATRPEHYVLVDDKLRILSAMKHVWGDRLTTVFPRQGHYAHDPDVLARVPAGRRHHRADRRPGRLRPAGAARRAAAARRNEHESRRSNCTTRARASGSTTSRASCSTSGTLARYIDELSVTGLTSNPTIFDHAIEQERRLRRGDPREDRGGQDGRGALLRARARGPDARGRPLPADPRARPNGVDGWVSLEVSPMLAYDTASTDRGGEGPARARRPSEPVHQDPGHAGRAAGDRGVRSSPACRST